MSKMKSFCNSFLFTLLTLLFLLLPSMADAAPNGTYFGKNQNGTDYEALFIMAMTNNSENNVRVIFATNPGTGYPGKPDIFIDGIVPVIFDKESLVFKHVPDETRCMGFFDVTISPIGGTDVAVNVTGSGSGCGTINFKGLMKRTLWSR